MPVTTSSLFVDFERSLKNKVTLDQFLASLGHEVTLNNLLSLVGIDIEYRFRTGEAVDLGEYRKLVPASELSQLDSICADSIRNFVNTHCPVREALGALPAKFEHYQFLREIARGGSGVVYEAEDLRLNRRVAIKVLFRNCRTLANEAKIMSSFDHPNICTIHDTGELDGRIYVVMQLISGPSLKSFCRTPPVLSCEQAVSVMIKVLKAVDQCHCRGIVHMDLKPANILMADQQPIIIDFGLARVTGVKTSLNNVLGSPHYMAPELFQSELHTPATMCDVFSLGVVFYELLTGKRPFNGLGDQRGHIFPPRRPSDHRSEISTALERICLRAIEENPGQRYQSARDFRSDLEYWVSGGIESLGDSSAISEKKSYFREERLSQWITWMLLFLILVFTILNLAI